MVFQSLPTGKTERQGEEPIVTASKAGKQMMSGNLADLKKQSLSQQEGKLILQHAQKTLNWRQRVLQKVKMKTGQLLPDLLSNSEQSDDCRSHTWLSVHSFSREGKQSRYLKELSSSFQN